MNGQQLLELILNASVVVQLVMLILLLMSIAVWAVGLAKRAQLRRAEKALQALQADFDSEQGLQLYYDLGAKPYGDSEAAMVLRAGVEEFLRLNQQQVHVPAALLEGAERAMQVALQKAHQRLDQMLPTLATVGSSAPYIGLFGTVWGVMNAFAGLAQVKQATLSAVAPGIAEALIATAMGLFAAIPAVIAYNRLTARANRLSESLEALAESVLVRLHRQALRLQQQVEQG